MTRSWKTSYNMAIFVSSKVSHIIMSWYIFQSNIYGHFIILARTKILRIVENVQILTQKTKKTKKREKRWQIKRKQKQAPPSTSRHSKHYRVNRTESTCVAGKVGWWTERGQQGPCCMCSLLGSCRIFRLILEY